MTKGTEESREKALGVPFCKASSSVGSNCTHYKIRAKLSPQLPSGMKGMKEKAESWLCSLSEVAIMALGVECIALVNEPSDCWPNG